MSLTTAQQGISYAIRGDNTDLRRAFRESVADSRAFGRALQEAVVGPSRAASAAQADVAGAATAVATAVRREAGAVAASGAALNTAAAGASRAASANASLSSSAVSAATAQARIGAAASASAAALAAQSVAAETAGTKIGQAGFFASAALGRQTGAALAAGAATVGAMDGVGAAATASSAAVSRASFFTSAALARQASSSLSAAAAATAGARESAAAAFSAGAAMGRMAVAAELAGATTAQSMFAAARAANTASAAALATVPAYQAMGAAGTSSLSGVAGLLNHLVGPLGFAALIALIAKTGVGFNDFLARQSIAFETMLGSASASKEFLSDMLAFAKTTPFSFPELTASAQKMVAFGIESSKVVDIMRTLGDATVGSGGSMAELSGLGIVLGQVSAKGRLMGQELLQFAERGIPALTVLANKANMSVADFQDEVSNGNVRADEAITNLIDGLRDGTDGINGTTAAYDGLMAKIKSSNIFSSAWDSFKSGFRTMSSELTESLTPALVALVNIGGDAMGAVKGIASAFNSLSGPTQSVALALTAVAIAGALLGNRVRGGIVTAFTAMNTTMMASRATAQAMGYELGRVRTVAMSARVGVAGLGSAISGAFGGVGGLAATAGIAAVTSIIALNAQASAQAKADADALRDTLDATTGAITEGTEAYVRDQLVKERKRDSSFTGLFDGSGSIIADAKSMGIAVEDLTAAYLGQGDAYDKVRDQAVEYRDALSVTDRLFSRKDTTADALIKSLDAQKQAYDDNIVAAKAKEEIDAAQVKTATELADAYRAEEWALHGFAEEQSKAIQSSAEASGKAFDTAFSLVGGFKAVTVTADELADARDKVTDATNAVRDAEDAQEKTRDKKKSTANDRLKAADNVTRALRNQSKAVEELTELEASDIPVADQMMEHYRKTLEDAQKFADDIAAVTTAGLDPSLVNDLVLAGPEDAAPQLQELLGANGAALIELANQTETELNDLNTRVVENARLTAIAMQSQLASTAADLPNALKIAAAQVEGRDATVDVLSKQLGMNPEDVARIAAQFGQDWVLGRDEYLEKHPIKVVADGKTAPTENPFAFGYEPEVDVTPGWVYDAASNTFLQNALTDGIPSDLFVSPRVTIQPAWVLPSLSSTPTKAIGGLPGPYLGGHFNGGVIPGYTPGRDTGFIGIGGGESVMRPEWTRGVGPGFVHRMNRIARSGGVSAVREAMAGFQGGYQGAYRNGGVVGQGSYTPPPQIIEVPVTQRVEHHGVQTFGDVYTTDAGDFQRQMRHRRRGSFTGGRP